MDLYIVTGHTKGLGHALAATLGERQDLELIALGRAPDGPIPGGAQLEVDLADFRAIDAAFDRVEERLRGKRFAKAVLLNNAGVISPVGMVDRVASDELERNLAVNFTAPILLMRRFLLATETCAKRRRVINISSGAARRPIFGWGAYCAAKAGIDMISRVAALEAQTARTGVEVVSLAPGVIDTPMQGVVRSASPEEFVDVERFRQMKAAGELRDPADVAADILRLEESGKLFADPVADLRTLGA
ncbi:MAG TPA: SDR family NAD(P)-dependent oxidoreductase [Usitatibacteraceae bacterium]|nr:SDR family NAD(P)-dependent oxidoreductase [Usitatibacteraceae bacterium]